MREEAERTCGTDRMETKLVASTTGSPAEARRLMSSPFTAALMNTDSFWRPSRGPTSTTLQ